MIATDRLLEVFVDAADTLVDDFDLVDFLHRVVDNAGALCGSEVVGLLLGDENQQLQYMAGTSGAARSIELFQIQSAEGPCLDSFHGRAPVIVPDLRDATERWPVFVPHVLAEGMRSVHAFPLRLREETIGALNVFGAEAGELSQQEATVVQALADIATIGIIQERAIRAAETLTAQLQGALNTRIVVEQAKGAVAQTLSISLEEAFTLLRAHARRRNLRLADVCRDVTERTLDPRTLVGRAGA